MFSRWFPKERLVRQALVGLLIWAVCGVVAAGLGTLGDAHFRWHDREGNSVERAVLQHGTTSPEAAAAVEAMGARGGAGTVIALIDPTSGTTVAAYPKDLVGKKPEEITVGGQRLPQLSYLQQQGDKREGEFGDGNHMRIEVSTIGFAPGYSGREDGHDRGWGRQDEGRGGRKGEWRGEAAPPQNTTAAPDTAAVAAQQAPLLVVAAPARAVSATEVAAGVLAAIAALGFALYWLSVAWWAFKDARTRRMPAYGWGVLVLVTNLVGMAIYLLVRNAAHNCPACGAPARRGFAYCPECGEALRESCPNCGKELKAGWHYCAACGTPRGTGENGKDEG
jgi:hypothetical protein